MILQFFEAWHGKDDCELDGITAEEQIVLF